MNLLRILKKVFLATYKGALFKGEFKDAKVLGMDLSQFLYDLEKREFQSGLFEKNGKKKQVFRDPDNEFVICGYINRLIQVKAWERAFLDEHYSVKNVFRGVGVTSSQASRIRIGNSKVVSLYPPKKVVCKSDIQNKKASSKKPTGSLSNEAGALRALKQLNCFKVPFVLLDMSICNADCVPAIWMEFIEENQRKKHADKSGLILRLLESLFSMYEAQGIEFGRLVNIERKKSRKELLGYGWNAVESEKIEKALKVVSNSRAVAPISYVHGDINPQNCIIDNHGGLVIIDWAHYRKDYILYDIFSLEEHGGEIVTERYKEWLGKIPHRQQNVLGADAQSGVFRILRYSNLKAIHDSLSSKRGEKFAVQQIDKIKQRVIFGTDKILQEIDPGPQRCDSKAKTMIRGERG